MQAMRVLWLVPLALAALLCLLGARAGLADLYLIHATTLSQKPANTGSAIATAALASQLAPWRPDAWLAQGKLSALQPSPQAVHDLFAQGLRLAPADAYAWRDYSLALARSEGYGSGYRMALARSQELAPNSRALHASHALNGLHAWRYGDEATRQLWRNSMRVTLAARPREFLRYIASSRREALFCAYTGEALNLGRWCADARALRRQCDLPDLAPRHRQYCDRSGFLEPPTHQGAR
jgi:hypothetical protein